MNPRAKGGRRGLCESASAVGDEGQPKILTSRRRCADVDVEVELTLRLCP
jgi:hypothetical protein